MAMVEVNLNIMDWGMAIFRSAWWRQLLGIALAVGLITCPSCRRSNVSLRIYNEGSIAIRQLTVRFPEDEVEFGDVGRAAFSSYRAVTHGVGPYASFRFALTDAPIKQYVADFVGWKPIKGVAFTYRVRVEAGRSQPFLNVLAVVRDR